MPSQTDEILIAGLRADVRQIAAEALKAAEAAGRAGVQAGLDAGGKQIVALRNQLALVMNDGLAKLAGETTATRRETERLRAAGAGPAVVRAVWVSALSAAALVAFGAAGGWFLGVQRASLTFHADTALARWAVTAAGREAYALDQANATVGGIGIFSRCTGRGWQVKVQDGRRVCWTYPQRDGVVGGWRLPGR